MVEKYVTKEVSLGGIYDETHSLQRVSEQEDERAIHGRGAIACRQLSSGLYTARSTRGTMDLYFSDPEYTTCLIAFRDDGEARSFFRCEIDHDNDRLAVELGAAATPGLRFWRRGNQQHELQQKLDSATEAFLNGDPAEVSTFPDYMITLDPSHRFLKEDELFESFSDEEYGEAFPRRFADSITHEDAQARLLELTTWFDENLGSTLQESYQKEEKFRENLGQRRRSKAKIRYEDLEGLLSSHTAKDTRVYGCSMPIFSPKDAGDHYLLDDPNTLLLALCRMQSRNPRDFMVDCYEDFSAFEVKYQREQAAYHVLSEATERWRSLDKNVLLEPEVRDALVAHEAAQKQVRIKGLRLCYLGMLYDTFQALPDQTIPQPAEYDDNYCAYVDDLTSALIDGMPSGLVTLAGDIAGALANVPIERSEDKMARKIIALFQEKAPKMKTEVHVQALRQQIANATDGYISLY